MNRRPAGVIAAAVVLGVFTTFLVLTAMIWVMMAFLMPHFPMPQTPGGVAPPPPGFMIVLAVLSTLFNLGLAFWGGATTVGLFRMRSWARISVMIIGAGIMLMNLLAAVFAILFATVAPLPNTSGADPGMLRVTFFVCAVFYLLLAGVGLWWLIYFARRRTREAFAWAAYYRQMQGTASTPYPGQVLQPSQNRSLSPGSSPALDFSVADFAVSQPPTPVEAPAPLPVPAESFAGAPLTQPQEEEPLASTKRPVSMTVIAILLLIGSLFSLLGMFSPFPIVLFGVQISGWTAHMVMLLFCAVTGVAGMGLLKLQKAAWWMAVGWNCLQIVNSLSLLLPNVRHHTVAYSQSVFAKSMLNLGTTSFDPSFFNAIFLISGAFYTLLYIFILVLLWRARWAYESSVDAHAAG